MVDQTLHRQSQAVPPPRLAALALWRSHLDAILALGEDLTSRSCQRPHRVDAGDRMRGILEQNRVTLAWLIDIRTLEASLILRLQQAFRLAAELAAGPAGAPRDIARLWHSGQVRAVLEITERSATSAAMDLAFDSTAYLRDRGLLPADAAGLADVDSLQVTEDMAIGGVTPLGVLLDAVAAALDALDAAGTNG